MIQNSISLNMKKIRDEVKIFSSLKRTDGEQSI